MPDFFAAHPTWFLAALFAGVLLVRAAGPLWLAMVFALACVVALFSPAGLVLAGGLLVWAGARVAGARIIINVHGDNNRITGPFIIDNSKGSKDG